jgi:hypothetical protein
MKRTARGLGVACVVAATVIVAAACGGGDPVVTTTQCVPRESKACTGLGPCKGQQVCGSNGEFGPCICGDASVIEDAGLPDVGKDTALDAALDQAADVTLDVGPDAPPFEAGVFDGGPTHWARAFVPEGTSYGVVVDANQNIIVGGGGTGLGEGITKLNAKGATQWHKTISLVLQVAVDVTGAVYAAGFKDGSTLDFGGGPVTAAGGFLVKYDANGVFQWLYGPLPNTQFNDVAVKSNGDPVVVGQFGGTVDFGNGNVSTPLGVLQATWVELAPSGTFVREKHYGVDGGSLFKSVAIDASDNIFLAGSFDGTSITFGGPTIPSPMPGNATDVFVVKLNASGGYVAQADGKSRYNDYLNDMALDGTGRPYLTGTLGSQIQFGSSPVVAFGSAPNVYVALLDASLNEVWARRFGQGGIANAIAVDPGGGALITGSTSGSLYFGLPGMPTVQGSYIARFDGNGNAVKSQGYTVANGGGVTGWGLAHVKGSDFVWVGNCGGGLLGLPSGPLACSFSNSGNGFVVRLVQ